MPAILFTGDRRLNAANDCIICCLLCRHALSCKCLDRRRIVEDLRMAISGTDTLDGLYLYLIGGALMHSH